MFADTAIARWTTATLTARRTYKPDHTERRIETSAPTSLSDSVSFADARLSEEDRCDHKGQRLDQLLLP